jgi:hypothetical protein
MAPSLPRSSPLTPVVRLAYFCTAFVPIHFALALDLRHPLQLTMDILAPLPFFLLAATNSYRSPTTKAALATALLLWAVMLAQPLLQPHPWRF